MKKALFIFCGLVLLLSSCSTLTRTANIANGVNTDVVINPIVANVDLAKAQKVEGSSKATYLLFFRISGDNKMVQSNSSSGLFGLGNRSEKVRNAAVYNALSSSDYDILANPRYTIETVSHLFGIFKIYKVQVVGYGANITDMHQIQPGEDAYDTLLYMDNVRDITIQPLLK